MAESFVMIQEDYKKVYKVWAEIADSEADEITDDEIICDDMYFEDSNGGAYYYSYVVLQRVKPLLSKVQGGSMKEKAEKLQELLNSEGE